MMPNGEDCCVPSRDRLVRRGLLAASAAIGGLALAVSPARAAITKIDAAALPPYGGGTLPAGIRSRIVESVNGLGVHLLEAGFEAGNRPLLLLLHGYPEIAYSWRKVMPPLAEAGYHVIAPDMRGFGRTTGWDDSYDCDLTPFFMLNMVRDQLALIAAFGRQSVAAVVGHDAGSPLAAWCALTRPDVFKSLVMMSAPFTGAPNFPTDTANGKPASPAPPAYRIDDAALAALRPPRRHYTSYYASRDANDNIVHARQGLHDFLRAYYHVKSADWAGNKPTQLAGWTAAEFAKAAALLCHGPRQGHGRDCGALHAIGQRGRRLQVADRARAGGLRRRICQNRLSGRA